MLQTFADGRLFGARSGEADPLVLALHGWGRTHRDFDACVRGTPGAHDEGSLDAIAVDLPGFGATPAPPAPWGSAQYAECISGVFSQMREPVVVVGHSFGGCVALHLAAAHAPHVRALVLTGVPRLRATPRRRPPVRYRMVRSLHRGGLVSAERMERARQRHGSPDYRAATGVMRQVHSRVVTECYEAQLDAVQCPVSLLWGADDKTVPLAVAEAGLARLRAGAAGDRAELEIYEGVGHLLPLSAPMALRAAVERHLL